MKTRITELFGIEYPIILSGMSWISVPKVVAAVSNAGGLGILATGPLSLDETREAIREVRSLTDKPFGANASLLLPGGTENAAILIEEKVPVINFALGKGDWIVKAVHKYGGKVIATVINSYHAGRAQDYGTDALIVTGHEAAGHGGDATSIVLIPSIAKSMEIPIIAAGGFTTGGGLAAALALGAHGIAMGSRFMTTAESPLHENFKELSVKKTIYDTIYTVRIDGIPCRFMDAKGARRAKKRGLNLFAAFLNSRIISKQLNLPYFKLFLGVLASGPKNAKQMAFLANAYRAASLATEDGDIERGVLPVGQVTGLIDDIPTIKELMERIVEEAIETRERIKEMI
jgi:enoyl-[acyl-carrier protein] reductase II